GAEPLFLTDYIACGRVVPERVAAIVSGVAEGCRQAGCALIGGETAEHPGLLGPEDFDLAGAATGIVEEDRLLGGHRVLAGDAVVGRATWRPAGIFEVIARTGGIAQDEMERTFNQGVGMVALLPAAAAAHAARAFAAHGVPAWVAGEVTAGSGSARLVGVHLA